MPKKRLFLLILFIFSLSFIFSGCFKKQEAETDIWSDDKVLEEEEISPGGSLQPDTSEKEVPDIGEVSKSKEDIKKLLDNLEKDGGVNLDIDEASLDINASALEESDVIAEPEDEKIDVSDIDNL